MEKTKEVTFYVHAWKNPYRIDDDSPEFITLADTSKNYPPTGSFLVAEHTVEVPLTWPEDTTTPQIDALKAEQEKAKKMYQDKYLELEEKIRELLALPAPE